MSDSCLTGEFFIEFECYLFPLQTTHKMTMMIIITRQPTGIIMTINNIVCSLKPEGSFVLASLVPLEISSLVCYSFLPEFSSISEEDESSMVESSVISQY